MNWVELKKHIKCMHVRCHKEVNLCAQAIAQAKDRCGSATARNSKCIHRVLLSKRSLFRARDKCRRSHKRGCGWTCT